MNEPKPEDVREALEICAEYENDPCPEHCPLYEENICNMPIFLNILREKDAEIERLHRVSAETNDCNFRLLEATKKSCEARINLAIREAITEFAERLKERMREVYPADIYDSDIDQIANELKEEPYEQM